MFGKIMARICLAAVAWLLTSCADPTYINKSGTESGMGAGKLSNPIARFSQTGQEIWLTWQALPRSETVTSFILKVGRRNLGDGSPVVQEVEGFITARLWMSSMGHGSEDITVTKVDVGTYEATDVFFSMTGEWELHIERRSVEGRLIEEAIIKILI